MSFPSSISHIHHFSGVGRHITGVLTTWHNPWRCLITPETFLKSNTDCKITNRTDTAGGAVGGVGNTASDATKGVTDTVGDTAKGATGAGGGNAQNPLGLS